MSVESIEDHPIWKNCVLEQEKRCALCLKQTQKIAKSHIIPKSILEKYGHFYIPSKQRIESADTIKMRMLCHNGGGYPSCEQNRLEPNEKKLENLVNEYLTALEDNSMPHLRYEKGVFYAVVSIAFKYCIQLLRDTCQKPQSIQTENSWQIISALILSDNLRPYLEKNYSLAESQITDEIFVYVTFSDRLRNYDLAGNLSSFSIYLHPVFSVDGFAAVVFVCLGMNFIVTKDRLDGYTKLEGDVGGIIPLTSEHVNDIVSQVQSATEKQFRDIIFKAYAHNRHDGSSPLPANMASIERMIKNSPFKPNLPLHLNFSDFEYLHDGKTLTLNDNWEVLKTATNFPRYPTIQKIWKIQLRERKKAIVKGNVDRNPRVIVMYTAQASITSGELDEVGTIDVLLQFKVTRREVFWNLELAEKKIGSVINFAHPYLIRNAVCHFLVS